MDDSKRYENRLVLILFFTWGTVFLDRMSQLYLAPYFAPEFHLSSEQIGYLASVVSITWAISAVSFGAISDRFGRRIVLIPCVLLFSVLSWLWGVAHSFEQLLLIRALIGAAEGPCWSVITAITEESSALSRRGRDEGSTGHALDTAGDHQAGVAALDGAGGDAHGFHAGPAQTIHGGPGNLLRQASKKQCHARHVAVIFASLIGATVDDIFHGGPIDRRVALHQGMDGNGGEIVGADRRQGAAVKTEGSAKGIADESFIHGGRHSV